MLLWIITTYFLATALGYLIHRSMHKRWFKWGYKSHLRHHALYPPRNFTSEKYKSAGSKSSVFVFVIAFIPFLAIPLIAFSLSWINVYVCIVVLLTTVFVGVVSDVVHASFHVKGHFLSKLPGHRKLQNLHYIHHLNVTKNFGIHDMTYDIISDTYASTTSEKRLW